MRRPRMPDALARVLAQALATRPRRLPPWPGPAATAVREGYAMDRSPPVTPRSTDPSSPGGRPCPCRRLRRQSRFRSSSSASIRQDTVAAAVESVLTQTAQDRIGEVFVVDDCSTDGTRAVVRCIATLHPKLTSSRGTQTAAAVPRLAMTVSRGPRDPCGVSGRRRHLAARQDRDPDRGPEAFPEIGLLFSDYLGIRQQGGRDTRARARAYAATDRRPAAPLLHTWRAYPAVLRRAEPRGDRARRACSTRTCRSTRTRNTGCASRRWRRSITRPWRWCANAMVR
jgi:hypothetical protein